MHSTYIQDEIYLDPNNLLKTWKSAAVEVVNNLLVTM